MIEPIEKAQKTWVLALTSVASLMPARKPMKAAAARSAHLTMKVPKAEGGCDSAKY